MIEPKIIDWKARAEAAERERDEWKSQAEAEAVVCSSYRDERDALAALAEERRQFILNAVELGYCLLPESETPDSAHDTYARCSLTNESAAARLIAEKQAEAVTGFAQEVWEELLRSYRSVKVMPLTMAKQWIESRQAEENQS